MRHEKAQIADGGWIRFPGGELEGKRPKVLCPACREQLNRHAGSRLPGPRVGSDEPRPLCFACYRAELDRDRALRAASELDTATPARFQSALPFEPVGKVRLEMLKAERAAARATLLAATGRFEDRRRQAQIAARHSLQEIAVGPTSGVTSVVCDRVMAAAIRAAELQLPESWLPFVVAR